MQSVWPCATTRVVLTNPDMFPGQFCQIIGHARLLSNLQLVVVDGTRTQVFGCHVALIVAACGASSEGARRPATVVLCSATMSEPSLHAAELTGLEKRDRVYHARWLAQWREGIPAVDTAR